MIYYVVSGLALRTKDRYYVAHDLDEDKYYWTKSPGESSVVRFEAVNDITDMITVRDEFAKIVNTGDELLLPELLVEMDVNTIEILKVVYFEPEQALNFSSVITDYNNRLTLFNTKKKELSEI